MEALNSYGRVSPPWWSEVWIIGSGPSVKQFDWNRIRGKQVLAVNDAIIPASSCVGGLGRGTSDSPPDFSKLTLFSLDNTWIRANRDLIEKLDCEKYLALPLTTWKDCGGIRGVTYLQWSHADGLCEDLRYVCTGCHSGYGALGIAYHKLATEIHLVGFDLSRNQHDRYWARNYDTTLPQLEQRGIRIFNHSEHSWITAFPKAR